MQHLVDDKALLIAHSAIQNLSLPIEDLNSMLQKMIPNSYPQVVLDMYDLPHVMTPTPIIRAIKNPFNIIYCVPPKVWVLFCLRSDSTGRAARGYFCMGPPWGTSELLIRAVQPLGKWACKFWGIYQMELERSPKTMFLMIYITSFVILRARLNKIIIQFWEILKIFQKFWLGGTHLTVSFLLGVISQEHFVMKMAQLTLMQPPPRQHGSGVKDRDLQVD